jgi:hypothetical protein
MAVPTIPPPTIRTLVFRSDFPSFPCVEQALLQRPAIKKG